MPLIFLPTVPTLSLVPAASAAAPNKRGVVAGTPAQRLAVNRIGLNALSDAVVMRILSHCTVETLLRCACTCKRLYRLATQPQLWARFYAQLCAAKEVLVNNRPVAGAKEPNYRAACVESLHIWNNWVMGRYKMEAVPGAHAGRLSCLTLLEDSNMLLSGGTDRTLKLWSHSNVNGWVCINTFTGMKAGVLAAERAYGSVVAGYRNGQLRMWSSKDWSHTATHHLTSRANGFVFDPRAVICWEDDIRLFDPARMALTATLDDHARKVIDVVPCHEHALFSCSADRTLKLWDRRTGRAELTARILGSSPTVMAVSPELHICTGTADGSVQAWDVRNLGHGPVNVSRLHSDAVRSLKYGYGMLVSTAEDGLICVWEKSAVRSLRMFNSHSQIFCSDFSNRRVVLGVAPDLLTTMSFDVL